MAHEIPLTIILKVGTLADSGIDLTSSVLINTSFKELRTSVVCKLFTLNRFIMPPLVQPTLVIPFQKDHILAVVIYNITQELEYLNVFDATIEIITNEDIKLVVLHLTKVFTQAGIIFLKVSQDILATKMEVSKDEFVSLME